MEKILSIIIPSYNMEAYLPKCVGSLIVSNEEILQKLDIIVINDGSKDRTSEIAHEFEAKYPGVVRVIDKPNGHYGSCVNRGLKEATGFYVRVLDADDYVDISLFQDYLKKVCDEADKGDHAADLIATNYKSVDPDGNVLDVSDFGIQKEGYYTLNEIKPNANRFTVHSIMYKTQNVRRMHYVQTEGQMYTDTEWIIEPILIVKRMLFLNCQATCYLVGREGQSMEDSVFYTHFQQVLNVTIKLARNYDSYKIKATNESSSYYHRQVYDMIRWVYTNMFLNQCGKLDCNANYIAFDKALHEASPCLYEATAQISFTYQIFPWKYFPLFYVKEWRKHYSFHTWKFLLFGQR